MLGDRGIRQMSARASTADTFLIARASSYQGNPLQFPDISCMVLRLSEKDILPQSDMLRISLLLPDLSLQIEMVRLLLQ